MSAYLEVSGVVIDVLEGLYFGEQRVFISLIYLRGRNNILSSTTVMRGCKIRCIILEMATEVREERNVDIKGEAIPFIG